MDEAFSGLGNSIMTREEKLKLAHTPPGWMYAFDLGDGIETPLINEELRSVHRTRRDMIEPVVDRFFPDGLEGKTALDIGCNEGWFSHLLYRRGAHVHGIDIREFNIERAWAIQDLYGYGKEGRLDFSVGDIFNLGDTWGFTGGTEYDVTFFLGILYHLENPMGALRILPGLTRTLAIIETQLTRQHEPLTSGWGMADRTFELPASFGVFCEPDQETSNLASYQTLSFIPNDEAVRLMLTTAGFSKVERVEAPTGWVGHNRQWFDGDRAVYYALK